MVDALASIQAAMLAAFGDLVTSILGGIAGVLPIALPVMGAFALLSAGFMAFRMVRRGK